MSKLSYEEKKALPDSVFGLIKDEDVLNEHTGKREKKRVRKYPMPDKAHARDAKARASEEYNAGNLTEHEKKQIDAMADKILGEK